MNYDETMEYLHGLSRFGIKPGLDRAAGLLEAMGNPQRGMRAVHIAGTNGKGSTAAMIESVLRAAGRRTGLFTSPHLQRYTERMRVAGQEIPKDELAGIISNMVPAIQRLAADPAVGAPTEFEVATAACFEWFRRSGVEIAIVEVGLGGRYDSTNVITPSVCVITHIAMDHMEQLGNTLGEIASDKAGIIKPRVPVVFAPQEPEALAVLESAARDVGAPSIAVGRDVGFSVASVGMQGAAMEVDMPGFGRVRVTTALVGRHQAENCATAMAALGVLGGVSLSEIDLGLAAVVHPGRFEVVQTSPFAVVLDGAHNPDGARALARTVEDIMGGSGRRARQRVLVLGCSKDKRVDQIVAELAPHFDLVIATAPEHTRSGAAEPSDIASLVQATGVDARVECPAGRGVELALQEARTRGASLLVVSGSLYLIGEVRGMWRD
ncbi:MAG: folylpolyglutamate synthase/dihydrofolate synthase family protein [Clostridia bacterium]|nr:folylpolyglutamate synthase/dihydrofolate synthase family protein [Clostridia bacterium]